MLPKLLEIGPIVLHSYGLLLVTAVLSAIALAAFLAEKQQLPRTYAWDLGFVIVLSSVIGAKLLMVLGDWRSYIEQPSMLVSLEFLRAGGVYYGGLLAATAASAVYIWRRPQMPFWKISDAAAPAIALGQSIGRIGCFAAGCDYGKPSDLPWAVTFTNPYANQLSGVPLNTPLHPAQLYESATTLVIFAALLFWFYRKSFDGQVFCLYLIFYSVARFFLEFFRGDVDRGFVFGWLSTSQFISVILFPVAIGLYFYLRGRNPKQRRRA